jgi:hypothetical protein
MKSKSERQAFIREYMALCEKHGLYVDCGGGEGFEHFHLNEVSEPPDGEDWRSRRWTFTGQINELLEEEGLL